MSVLTRYLRDFGDFSARSVGETRPTILPEQTIQDAERAAYERGVEDATARSHAALDKARAEAAVELEAQQRRWNEECQERLCREAAEGRAAIEQRISRDLADAIAPFIEERQRAGIARAFAALLREIMPAEADIVVNLSGPAKEKAFVLDCLGGMGIKATYETLDGRVIEASVGSTTIRADFDSWLRRLLSETEERCDVAARS
ncbi:MAG: hypothetical protein ACK5JM_03640 [Rhodoblastus sp.]